MSVQAAIRRLDRSVSRHRRLVFAGWLIAILAAVPFARQQTEHLTDGGFVSPDSQSALVDRELPNFPGAAGKSQQAILLSVRPGTAPEALDAAARRARAAVAGVPHARVVPVPRAAAGRFRTRDAELVPVAVDGNWDERIDSAEDLRERLGVDDGPRAGVTTALVGQDPLWAAVHRVQKDQLASAERLGFPIAFIILLLTFGSLAAAALPLALGAVTVTLTGAVIYFLSQAMSTTVFVTNAASMVGIGVAIDYSLFVLARYREEIAKGAEADVARRTALETSGLAVVFSGVTLIVSLLGVFLADSATLRSMAVGMIVVVCFSILGAVTLLPALIALLGRRASEPGRTRALTRATARRIRGALRMGGHARDFWERWTALITRRSAISLVLGSAIMLTLAAPALDMHLGNSAIRQLPRDDDARTGTEAAARLVGAGALGPVQEIVTFHRGTVGTPSNRATLARHVAWLRTLPEVQRVDAPQAGSDPRRALLNIVSRSGVEADQTFRLVDRLRSPQGLGTGADVDVGGSTALLSDFNDLVSASMWKIALFVVVLGFLVLMVMLRSVVLPLNGVLLTLLSVLSAYGLLVVVFQWGWFDGLFGYQSPGYINALAPPLLFAVTFGLSMDYELFLLVRIREAVTPGVNDREAVAQGLRNSAGTITGAALIMVSVFAIFATVGADAVKQIGFGEAAAIALDATVVRLVLVPATMQLMGRWNWWFPHMLERRVPRLAFETGPAPTRVGSGAAEAK